MEFDRNVLLRTPDVDKYNTYSQASKRNSINAQVRNAVCVYRHYLSDIPRHWQGLGSPADTSAPLTQGAFYRCTDALWKSFFFLFLLLQNGSIRWQHVQQAWHFSRLLVDGDDAACLRGQLVLVWGTDWPISCQLVSEDRVRSATCSVAFFFFFSRPASRPRLPEP